ncbi:biotin-independent malonate decarboxylase subunit gamma [uncultured Massilia sp.]|uniref:biotin-independent malonate decarboxylase subunit gamma n=1 Tax=uncultured Massilia sp. TaxID=169973 RepID=UPI0025FDC6E0|nr:biotin-independent malonate decarboxylase subunit gamma [uncultured Massilia sp.]
MDTNLNAARGAMWLRLLTGGAAPARDWPAVKACDAILAGRPARYIAVVPDPDNRFLRARNGEVGLVEGWQLAAAVQDVIALDRDATVKRPIVAVIDVPSQAYGRREEAYGIHQALAGAAGAYARARQAGHPVIGLVVGLAMSGAFLAHGYQANRLIALDDPAVQVHAMGKASAARVTLRSVDALERLAASVPPMAYDVHSFASLGILWRVLQLTNLALPDEQDLALVHGALEAALADILDDPERDLSGRLQGRHRAASRRVRALLRAEWEAAD